MKERIYFESKVKKSKSPIEKTIKALGINYPNESLGFLHAVYAKVDGKTPNKNRVILAKTVKKDVPQLKFTQANINHQRAGYVIGTILDAFVNKETEEIEIVFSFFKTLYSDHWKIVEKAITDNEMSVSFELMVEKDDVVQMANGVRKLKHVTFDGVGLLFPGVNPAYPEAKVLESANMIVNTVFKDKNLICASAKEAVEKIEKALIEKQKGELTMEDKIRDALLAKFKEEVIAELGEEAVKDWSDEQWEAELKKQADAEDKTEPETTEASESEAEESKDKEEAEEKESKEEKSADEKVEKESEEKSEASDEQAEKTTVVVNEKVKTEQTYDDVTKEETVKTESERTVERDGKKVVEEKVNRKITYTYAQMEEVKSEYEKQIEEKDKEIAFLKDNAKTIVEIRAELGDFVKDFSDEDLLDDNKLENARLKKRVHELENKDVETAEDKEDAEEIAKDEDMKTGHEEKDQKEEETADERVSQYLKTKYGK